MAVIPSRAQRRPQEVQFVSFTRAADAADIAAWCGGTVLADGVTVQLSTTRGDGSKARVGDTVFDLGGGYFSAMKTTDFLGPGQWTDKPIVV